MQQSTLEVVGAALFLLVVSITDIRTLRIPNRATALFLFWELLFIGATDQSPLRIVGLSLLTALLWGVLALYLGMGGGDFKLLFPLALLLRSPVHLFYALRDFRRTLIAGDALSDDSSTALCSISSRRGADRAHLLGVNRVNRSEA